MKTFKEFNTPEEVAVFCNAGGRIGQYDNIKFPTDNKKEFVAFSNAGGPPGQYDDWGNTWGDVNENLNPKIDTEFIRSNSVIFTDPIRNNHQLGEENNTPKNVGIPDFHGFGYVTPHNTAEHGKLSRILSINVKEDTDYHNIISKYTTNSHVLNKFLHYHGINGTTPPRVIRANENENSEIDTEKFDRIINSHLTKQEMVVYSGLHIDPSNRSRSIYINHPYMSTSINPHVAKDFGTTFSQYNINGDKSFVKHILRIIVPKNYPHLFTDNGSVFPGQSEVILPRHTRFHLGQRSTHFIVGHFNGHFDDKPHRDGEQLYHIWSAKLLPQSN